MKRKGVKMNKNDSAGSAPTLMRHGDVLLMPAPAGTKKGDPIPREMRGIVLAHGEATGHAHLIPAQFGPDAVMLFGIEGTTDKYLEVYNPVPLMHEEHATFELPAGNYVVRRQREYTPKGIRQVVD